MTSAPAFHSTAVPDTFTPNPIQAGPYAHVDMEALGADLRALREEMLAAVGEADLAHLRRFRGWGRMCTALGYATAWIAPNPLSACLLAQGNFARWSLVTHPISHRAYDRIPGVDSRLTSRGFARGWRRFVDWLDWITPEAWHEEHDLIHHFHLTEPSDPDHVEINLEWLRKSRLPMPLRYAIVAAFATIWKPIYYAPNTLKELRASAARRRGEAVEEESLLSWRLWNPMTRAGRALWTRCYLPYAGVTFIALPALFAPLGVAAATNVLLNSLAGEALANLQSFLMIVPNHAGKDLPRFEKPVANKAEFFARQIVGTVNYRTGGSVVDFFHGFLNYHIEHHLFPDFPLLQYEKIQPRVIAICEKHGLPYRQESVFRRLLMAVEVMVGKADLQRIPLDPDAFRLEPPAFRHSPS